MGKTLDRLAVQPLKYNIYDHTFAYLIVFFFNDTATTEIYTLSLHDALPISIGPGDDRTRLARHLLAALALADQSLARARRRDRKSTRLNSSHQIISYAVFCFKKKTPPRGSAKHSTLCN